jgi:ABC-type multidrug transport system fused ATPase/permease subunit
VILDPIGFPCRRADPTKGGSISVMDKFYRILDFTRKSYFLVRPYGLKKLALVFAVILSQGIFQVIGVTSIFPFLTLASNPGMLRESSIGARLLSHLPPMDDSQLLIVAGVFAILMLLFSNTLMLAGEVVRTRYAHGFGHWLRLRLLNRIVSNSYGYFLQRNTGELMKKAVGDVMTYVQSVLAPLLDGVARLITVLFLLGTLVLVNPLIALIAGLFFGIFYSLVFYLLRGRRRATSDALKLANRGAMREAQQLLGGIKPIKVHGVEWGFINRYADHSFVQSTLYKWLPIYQNAPRYLIEPLAFGGVVILVVILAARGMDFTSLIPTLGVMALAGYRIIPNAQLLYGAATGISLMMHSLEEVYEEFMEAEHASLDDFRRRGVQRPQPLEWRDAITLEHLSFRYEQSAHEVLSDITLGIRQNEFVAFIGHTGSGKTTLVDIILALHWPTGGRILVDGKPLERAKAGNWRAGIGYVPQEIFLIDDTISANIAFGIDPREIDHEQVRRVAEVAQIREFIETELPGGFDSKVGERGVRLSGGQRQRIGLARALYHKPQLLILDEATSALDNATESALMEAIERLYGRLTLIVIAHRLTTIRRADTIYQLDHGRIIGRGSYAELGLDGEATGSVVKHSNVSK